jgi:hypothetical protein
MANAKIPAGLDPEVLAKGRELIIEANAETTETMAKEGAVTGPAGVTFTLRCDEGKHVGGEASAPAPLDYFSIGIAF